MIHPKIDEQKKKLIVCLLNVENISYTQINNIVGFYKNSISKILKRVNNLMLINKDGRLRITTKQSNFLIIDSSFLIVLIKELCENQLQILE